MEMKERGKKKRERRKWILLVRWSMRSIEGPILHAHNLKEKKKKIREIPKRKKDTTKSQKKNNVSKRFWDNLQVPFVRKTLGCRLLIKN